MFTNLNNTSDKRSRIDVDNIPKFRLHRRFLVTGAYITNNRFVVKIRLNKFFFLNNINMQ